MGVFQLKLVVQSWDNGLQWGLVSVNPTSRLELSTTLKMEKPLCPISLDVRLVCCKKRIVRRLCFSPAAQANQKLLLSCRKFNYNGKAWRFWIQDVENSHPLQSHRLEMICDKEAMIVRGSSFPYQMKDQMHYTGALCQASTLHWLTGSSVGWEQLELSARHVVNVLW